MKTTNQYIAPIVCILFTAVTTGILMNSVSNLKETLQENRNDIGRELSYLGLSYDDFSERITYLEWNNELSLRLEEKEFLSKYLKIESNNLIFLGKKNLKSEWFVKGDINDNCSNDSHSCETYFLEYVDGSYAITR